MRLGRDSALAKRLGSALQSRSLSYPMAIYHAHIQVIGRSTGRSVVAAAGYRSASELHDNKLGYAHDYTAKQGVVHSEIMLPDGAPERWAQGTTKASLHAARSILWNEVEATERRKDAQLARELEFAIPRELPRAEAIRLAQDFVREQFVDRGMVADLNVHWDVSEDGGLKPHAHVMLTMRQVTPAGFGPKEREWNATGLYEGVRQRWAELANERLAEHGHDVRIDHRSYAEQGIALEPQNKIGPAGARRAARQAEHGEDAERAAEHVAIARRNGEAILADPGVVLDAITRQHSTFSRRDLARFVDRHTADAEQFTAALAKVEASAELVRVGVDGRGQDRFSTREMLGVEQRLEQAALELSESRTHAVKVDRRRSALESSALGGEQAAAFGHVTRSRDLAVVVGYAGTGKSTMLGVARQAWEVEGYRVVGAALSGIAAEGLEAGSGIGSRTLASLEFGWKDGRDLLTRRDVLVVDEAGMVGSRQMERVLSVAKEAGAKVVLVGDPEQLQAIEAGAAFRAIVERVGSVEITEVRRQREGWQRDATRELATGGTGKALQRYEQAGMVVASETRAEAMMSLVAGWDEERRQAPQASRVMLASTRADVAELNGLARERLRAAGDLGVDQVVETEKGERSFAVGDRVMFGRNERGLGAGPDGRGGVAVKNGTLGTVLAVEAGGERLTVLVDGKDGQEGKDVTFYLRDYGHVDHGYAATVHKAQGVTVDRAHVLASRFMDRHGAYVGLTRHRAGVSLHYGRDEFADSAALARVLGRERAKDTTLDYGERGGVEDLMAGYAERRGLNRLPAQQEAAVQTPAPRRSRFAGLRLDASRATERSVPVVPQPPQTRMPTEQERQRARLDGLAADYARAWSDAERMHQAALPVLPHQEQGLETAERALDGFAAGASRDVRAALEADPVLARGVNAGQGRQALTQAAAEMRRERLVLEERGREAIQAWGELERGYEAGGKRRAWDEQRQAGAQLEAFARELKGDPELDGLLRERGRELGIEAGSRLDQVVQAPEVDRRLLRLIAIEHEPRQRSGPSLGMGR